MTKYLKLARVTAWPAFSAIFIIPFAVGAYVATSWSTAVIGFSALLSFAGFAFALNFYSDRDTDRSHDGIQKDFNLSKQPMVTGEVTEQQCKVFCIVTLLLAIALGFLVSNLFALLVILACIFGGILYSHPWIRLKAKPLGDILCLASLGVIVPSAGFLLGAGSFPTPLLIVFWFLVTATAYTASVISDYSFDLKAGLRTSAVYFGRDGAIKIMGIGCLLCLIVALFIFNGYYVMGTRYFALFAVICLIALTAFFWISSKSINMHISTMFFHRYLGFITKRISAIRAILWRSLETPAVIDTTVHPRGRWFFMAPGIVSLVFICYASLNISGLNWLPFDPFLVY